MRILKRDSAGGEWLQRWLNDDARAVASCGGCGGVGESVVGREEEEEDGP